MIITVKNHLNARRASSVILSDPLCKDDDVRFTTETLKPKSDKNVEDIAI